MQQAQSLKSKTLEEGLGVSLGFKGLGSLSLEFRDLGCPYKL